MKILRGQVPPHAVGIAESYIRSLSDEERETRETVCQFDVLQLLAYLPPVGRWDDPPQIVWHTNEKETLSMPHIDEPRGFGLSDQLHGPDQVLYGCIMGVAITAQTKENGAVVFGREGDAERPVAVMEPGDVLSMAGDEYHLTGRPASDEPRIIVYFRFFS